MAATYYLNDLVELEQLYYECLDDNKILKRFYNLLERTVRKYAWYPDLNIGDIVCINSYNERIMNRNCFIYNGFKFEELDTSIDPNGNIPKSYKICDTDFSPYHWDYAIRGNCILWLDKTIIETMEFVLDETTGNISSEFYIGSKKYICYVDEPNDLPFDYSLNLRNLNLFIGKTMGYVRLILFSKPDKFVGEYEYDSSVFLHIC
jgi:hypothetical protein